MTGALAVTVLAAGWAAGAGGSESRQLFHDGFEKAAVWRDLFPKDGSRWYNIERTHDANRLDIAEHDGHSGNALKLTAIPSDGTVSKAAVLREGFRFAAGQTLTISAWFFIPEGAGLKDLFLLDVECRSCWPKNSSVPNKSPGVRVALEGRRGIPALDRSKIGLNTLRGGGMSTAFPRDRWVELKLVVKLSTEEDGFTEIYLDGQKVVSRQGINMPNAAIFRKHGLELQQPVFYEYVEVGITANGTSQELVLMLDEVTVSVQ